MATCRTMFTLCWFLLGQLVMGGRPCPFLFAGTPLPSQVPDTRNVPSLRRYNRALRVFKSRNGLRKVFDDLYDLMEDSQTCWPADEIGGNRSYAGLFLRLAWHAAGTFRDTDQQGGSFGGRQRYQPESAWDDNANLDKARALLGPIKKKYGDALSWGDLMIFAGTAAILHGGGPVTNVCVGRHDDVDGTNSQVLNSAATCQVPNNCGPPLGSSTVGLIYVNPEGFLGVPNPARTALQVRRIFARMGMNDIETVALIGGGHAFGKCHGACPLGAGPGPDVQPRNPWPGLCGQNFPQDTFTSGLEGAWTTYPFQWDNEFFTQLANDQYELIRGPGGKYQWRNKRNNLLMLTTDLAFVYDDKYKKIVNDFANNQTKLDHYFGATWEKLVNSGGTRAKQGFCVDSKRLRPRPKRSQSGSKSDSHSQSQSSSHTSSHGAASSGWSQKRRSRD